MASNLVIRNVDPELISALSECAVRHGRTLEEEHHEILRHALQRPHRVDPLEFIERARMLRAAVAPQLFQALDIDVLKRAGRK